MCNFFAFAVDLTGSRHRQKRIFFAGSQAKSGMGGVRMPAEDRLRSDPGPPGLR